VPLVIDQRQTAQAVTFKVPSTNSYTSTNALRAALPASQMLVLNAKSAILSAGHAEILLQHAHLVLHPANINSYSARVALINAQKGQIRTWEN